MIGGALLVGLFCLQSLALFDSLAEAHAGSGLQGRVTLLTSSSVFGFLLVAFLGSRVWDAQGDDDAEWLLTLPAPAWVLHSARLAGAALTNPSAWLMIFPFFTGLGLHTGLGLMAPVVAIGISLPICLVYAMLGSVIDVIGHGWARSPLFRALRILGPALGLLAFSLWQGAGALLGSVDLLGKWLDFSGQLAWLPFSEPARALLSWREAPLHALAWLGLFGAEMGILLGLGLLLLRKYHLSWLMTGNRPSRTRGAVHERARTAQRHFMGSAFKAAIDKELLCLWRNPALSAKLGSYVLVANGLALLLVSRWSALDATVRPGLLLFIAGGVLVIRLATLLELEQPALWQLAALPRSLSAVFGPKALLATVLATAGALPSLAYAMFSAEGSMAAWPLILYGAACIAVLAFFQTAVWMRNASPRAATSQLQELARVLQVLLVAGILSSSFSSGVAFDSSVQLLVFVAGFVVAFWQGSLERVPYVLDPDARQPATLTSTFAIGTLVLMGLFKAKLQGILIRDGAAPPRAAAAAVIGAGLLLGLSLLWLRLRSVPSLAERLGLVRGRGWRVIVREAALWSAPAIAIALVYLSTFGQGLSSLVGKPVAQQPMGVMMATASALTLVSVLCVAVPVIEEITFRGMLYRSLRSGYGKAFSVCVSSLVFTADHSLLSAVPLFCAAVCMALAFERSRSLYAAMLVHAAYNGCLVTVMLLQ